MRQIKFGNSDSIFPEEIWPENYQIVKRVKPDNKNQSASVDSPPFN